MGEREMDRRRFLSRTATGVAALGAGALLSQRALGANERISIGMIGVGGRGSGHIADISSLAEKHNVEITAVSDVYKPTLARAAATVKNKSGKEPRTFTRFGDLLALPDVQAVVISTADFSHCAILIAALKANKDVYVEKPMSIDIAEANQALDLARANKRVVQVGTQRRSEGIYRAVAKEVATGVLGHISRVSAGVHFNEPRWARNYKGVKESDVDWEAYVFNRPGTAFDPKLLMQWHLCKLCTNGLSGLWMSHYVDSMHIVTGAKYPSSAVAHGGIYVWKDGREHTDTFHCLIDYPEGFLWDWAMSLTNSSGSHFTMHGADGTLDVESGTLSPAGGKKDSKVPSKKIKAEPNQSHMGNWLECLRSREKPNGDIEYGHQHSVATVLAATALEKGTRMRYDPAKREMMPG